MNQNSPLRRTKFTRPPALRMKEIDIIALQNKSHKYRLFPRNSPSEDNWTNFWITRNELMKKIKNKKSSFYKRILTLKNKEEIWKIVYRVLNPSGKTPNAYTNELKKYFNETATCLITTKTHNKDEIKNLMESFSEKLMNFNYILFRIKTLCNLSSFYEMTALQDMTTYQQCSLNQLQNFHLYHLRLSLTIT